MPWTVQSRRPSYRTPKNGRWFQWLIAKVIAAVQNNESPLR